MRSGSLVHHHRPQDLVGEALRVFVVAGDGENGQLVVVNDEIAMEASQLVQVHRAGSEVAGLKIAELEGKGSGYSSEICIDSLFGSFRSGVDGDLSLRVAND